MRIHLQRAMIVGLLVAVGTLLAPAAAAANNAGDVKVHDPGMDQDQRNQPHVGCAFFVEGFNMDATSGTITFQVWPPSGDGSVVHATGAPGSWQADDTNAQGNHHFVSGPFHLPAMGDAHEGTHYKVTVSDTRHVKTKVFWTQCETTPTPPTGPTCQELRDCTPPPCMSADCANNTTTTPPTPPTTSVPFFPSATSMALGLAGAAGSVLLALRRRA
jgi:hypothetical protein